MYRYNVWKTDSKCNPIPGTERILRGKSKRWVIAHIAYEQGITITPGSIVAKDKDGNMWFAHKLANQKQ